jgi:DNA-binding transcriptional regulator LsrR (DeoR family)
MALNGYDRARIETRPGSRTRKARASRVRLAYEHGATLREIAAVLGVTHAPVAKMIARAGEAAERDGGG